MLKILSQDKDALVIIEHSARIYISQREGKYYIALYMDGVIITLGTYCLLNRAEFALEEIMKTDKYYVMPE